MDFNNIDFLEAYPLLMPLDDDDSIFSDFNIVRAIQAEFCVNEIGQILYINEAMCCLSQYSREELLRMTLFEIDTSILLENWNQTWLKLKTSGSVTFTLQHLTKANQVMDVEISICYVKQNGIEFGCAFVSPTIPYQSLRCFNDKNQAYLDRCLLN
ncbi:PAS/PAC sensor signal transduction histidine kinase [Calothrix sp. NIES-4071]|nr:PAS/PAC sensor signal transduction histidine kinase [Calothrix sp. NIES-4071]BAZ59996.1 PAS/PAC sensor signal transduction histidine kinase [Calothrix sp. NIES-4105]